MASGLGMIPFMRLDDRRNIQSVKPAQPILYSGLEAQVLPPQEGNDDGHQTNTLTRKLRKCVQTKLRLVPKCLTFQKKPSCNSSCN